MNDAARQKLCELVVRFGSGLGDDPRRCEALLRDVCGQCKPEISVLVSAARERVPSELLATTGGAPLEATLSKLTMRLHENIGLTSQLARWGIESWALALNVVEDLNHLNPDRLVPGQTVAESAIDEVCDLSVRVERGMLTARWQWPPEIDAAVLCIRTDGFAAGAQDPRAMQKTYTRGDYDRYGGYRQVIPIDERCFLTVYAAKKVRSEWHFSPGASRGSRFELLAGRSLKFQVKCKRFVGFMSSAARELTISTDCAVALPGLVLVGKAGGLPLHPADGTPLVQINRGVPCLPDNPVKRTFKIPGFGRHYQIRLFPMNEEDCDIYDIVDES